MSTRYTPRDTLLEMLTIAERQGTLNPCRYTTPRDTLLEMLTIAERQGAELAECNAELKDRVEDATNLALDAQRRLKESQEECAEMQERLNELARQNANQRDDSAALAEYCLNLLDRLTPVTVTEAN